MTDSQPTTHNSQLVPQAPKARYIVFDIETYRTTNPQAVERITTEAVEKRPANNTLKELKLAWDTEEARKERAAQALAKTAVDPILAEILCVCWMAEPGKRSGRADLMRGHPDTLSVFAQTLDELAGPETIWIGHNIAGFDLPVLLNSWRRAGVKPPEHFPRYYGPRRWSGRIFDTMLRVPCKDDSPFISLKDACDAYGIGPAKVNFWNGEEVQGSTVGPMFEAGDYDAILDYCMHDVVIEEQLYRAMTCGDTWGTWDSRDAIAEQIAEIESSAMTEGAKALAIYRLLDSAGLIPRAA